MVLSNSGSLFQQTDLLNDDGTLRERWGQSGSTIVNLSFAGGNGADTKYTVTAGKTFYVKTLTMTTTTADGDSFVLEDGNGGTQKFAAGLQATTGIPYSFFYDTPLTFETSVYYDPTGTPNVAIVMSGWEE